jgi:hypothetical protein
MQTIYALCDDSRLSFAPSSKKLDLSGSRLQSLIYHRALDVRTGVGMKYVQPSGNCQDAVLQPIQLRSVEQINL